MKSYCVKQKKQTECVEPSGTSIAKNGKYYFWCTCAECGIKKKQDSLKTRETNSVPSRRGHFRYSGINWG